MKVSLTISIDVKVDEWIAEFGHERPEVRQDVKSYFETLLHGSYPATEGIVEITVKQ